MNELARVNILAVDDDSMWRGIFGRALLARSDIISEVVDDADSAIDCIRTGEVTGVITDGLEGRWTDVCLAAGNINIPVVVMSGLSVTVQQARSQDIEAYNKTEIDPLIIQEVIDRLAMGKIWFA